MARMPELKGEAGVSPALSRNCKGKARYQVYLNNDHCPSQVARLC